MTDRFKVGDRVRIIKAATPSFLRLEATIMSAKIFEPIIESGRREWVYRLDIQGYGTKAPDGNTWAAPEDWLAPIYDGWDKTEWKDCYWKPKILEKV